MANRFPLIIDTDDGNKFKELPVGDNLNLQGSSIINASSVEVLGNLDVQSLTVNEQNLSTVAVTGDYNDLNNIPAAFSGNYNDLSSKPSVPTTTKDLTDVSLTDPTDGQILVFNSVSGTFEPKDQTDIDLSASSINNLQDVITTGTTELKYLKYQSGAWRPGNINYSEILNKPTNVSQFVNDTGYLDATVFSAGNSITNEATNTYSGNNIHDGFETFNNRVDFFATVNISNAGSNTIVNTTDMNITASNVLSIQSQGLVIQDDGAGVVTISDNDTDLGINFAGPLSFTNAVLQDVGDITLGAVEATSVKGDIISSNLNEDLIIDISEKTASFVSTTTESLNVSQGTDPASAIGSAGDTAGDIIIGSDQGATRYFYYCGADYDGASSIWYRVAMSNNW